jgi:hypothetical protein
MDRVMNCLLNRHAVEVSMRYPYGGYEMMADKSSIEIGKNMNKKLCPSLIYLSNP